MNEAPITTQRFQKPTDNFIIFCYNIISELLLMSHPGLSPNLFEEQL